MPLKLRKIQSGYTEPKIGLTHWHKYLISPTKYSEVKLHTGVLEHVLTMTKYKIMQKFLSFFIFFIPVTHGFVNWRHDIFQFLGIHYISMSEEQLTDLSIPVSLSKEFSIKMRNIVVQQWFKGSHCSAIIRHQVTLVQQ